MHDYEDMNNRVCLPLSRQAVASQGTPACETANHLWALNSDRWWDLAVSGRQQASHNPTDHHVATNSVSTSRATSLEYSDTKWSNSVLIHAFWRSFQIAGRNSFKKKRKTRAYIDHLNSFKHIRALLVLHARGIICIHSFTHPHHSCDAIHKLLTSQRSLPAWGKAKLFNRLVLKMHQADIYNTNFRSAKIQSKACYYLIRS
jgi:hypothetical protein